MTVLSTHQSRTSLLDFIARHPAAVFLLVVASQFVVWTALPSLFYRALPLDGVEALIYGREWQLGYVKLPPLPWWAAEAVYRILPYDAAYYALYQTFIAITLAIVWLTSQRIVGPLGALASILIVRPSTAASIPVPRRCSKPG